MDGVGGTIPSCQISGITPFQVLPGEPRFLTRPGNVPALEDCRGREDVVTKELKWRELGACRGLEPAIFYPDDDDEAVDAKAVCSECAVRVTCLEFALQVREKQGVWGGATERERRRMIRQRRRTA